MKRWYFRARSQPGGGAGIGGARPARIVRPAFQPGSDISIWPGWGSLCSLVITWPSAAGASWSQTPEPAGSTAPGGWARGIEVRLPGQPSYYFWTRDWQNLIAALKAAGFDVADEETQFP